MTDTVEAQVAQMRTVATALNSRAALARAFHSSIQALARGLLVESFATAPLSLAAELVNELPIVALMLRNRANAAEAADRGGDPAEFDHTFLALTGDLKFGLGNLVGASGSEADLLAHFGRLRFSPLPDLGGTYTQEYRGGFMIEGSDTVGAGRDLIGNLMLTTADDSLIGKDEFQLISVNGGTSFILVLAGVTDLSDPDLGLSEEHRSVRDMDQYARRSATSTSIADNEYARMVRNALIVADVPFGADLAIVGHSYGADTALDLAADAEFNGGQFGFNVTHVVAAAYNSGPQLRHVANSTEVLVLQNDKDVPVMVEMGLDAPNRVIQANLDFDPIGRIGAEAKGVKDFVWGVGDAVVDAGQLVGGLVVNGGSAAINQTVGRLGAGELGAVDWGDLDDIYLIEDGVTHPTDHQTVVVFEGGFVEYGHDQQNYIEHIEATTDQSTLDFYASLADAGYTGTMDRWSIDVSVPE